MVRLHTWVACVVSVPVFALGACQSPHEHKGTLHEQQEAAEAAEAQKPAAPAEAALAKPATTLAAAIATAQKSVPDGRFMVARMENEDGKTTCNIVLVSGEAQREVSIDTATGAILATENQELDPEGKEILTEFWSDPKLRTVEPLQAIEAALTEVPGAWAVYAALSGDDGKPVYAIVVLDGNTAKVAQVSAADGKVQKVSVLEEEDEGEEGMEESKEKKEEAPPGKPK